MTNGEQDGAQDGTTNGKQDSTRDGMTNGARDSTADETGDGANKWIQDGATDKTPDEAWDRAEPNDTDVEHDVDQPQRVVVKKWWVSKVWFSIASLCLGRLCDQVDFAPMSGPNEGVFLFPGY